MQQLQDHELEWLQARLLELEKSVARASTSQGKNDNDSNRDSDSSRDGHKDSHQWSKSRQYSIHKRRNPKHKIKTPPSVNDTRVILSDVHQNHSKLESPQSALLFTATLTQDEHDFLSSYLPSSPATSGSTLESLCKGSKLRGGAMLGHNNEKADPDLDVYLDWLNEDSHAFSKMCYPARMTPDWRMPFGDSLGITMPLMSDSEEDVVSDGIRAGFIK